MAGYLVLPDDACDWTGNDPSKVKPNPIRLGLFDLVRQFEQVPFPYDRRSPGVCLYGLDKLFAQMGVLEGLNDSLDQKHGAWVADVRRRLRAVANEVSNMGTIHVPVSFQLDCGAGNQLYAKYTGKRIPLWRLFGSHPSIGSEGGHATYTYAETLS